MRDEEHVVGLEVAVDEALVVGRAISADAISSITIAASRGCSGPRLTRVAQRLAASRSMTR